jgi:hypothetical protein
MCHSRQRRGEIAMGVCAVDTLELNFGEDSSYQNLDEFMEWCYRILPLINSSKF